ncbi:MAG: hypothetical protein F4Z55_12325 [Boseongicola sp. SB0667_bin_21]|nr:hypothetical protein [Boseongicola sp. SB0667_bin_21]
MFVTPALANEQDDIAVAERLLMATELGTESGNAALERANAAFVAVISKEPDSDVMRGFRYTLERCFREKCKDYRFLDNPEYSTFKTDEQLESQGCYTRPKANMEGCGKRSFKACEEPLPENVSQVALDNYGILICLTDNPRAKSIRDSLYDLFFDEEVEKRLQGVAPTEREAIKSQIGSSDI